jgi:hypothetical protein
MVQVANLAGNLFILSSFAGAFQTIADEVGGAWANKSGYLGFKFSSRGQNYFGWAKLHVTADHIKGETGYIPEYAYNTCPGQSITAGQTTSAPCPTAPTPTPEPSTLSLLALGAAGLRVLRRRRLAANTQGTASE